MAKLTKCKVCGADVAKSAKACPQCGARIKKHTVLGIVFIVFGIMLIVAAVGGSSDEPEKVGGINNTAPAKATVVSPTAEPTFSPVVLQVSNWEITITGFYFDDNISLGIFTEYQPDENAQFAIVELTAKNTGTEADVFLPLIPYGNDVIIKLVCNGYTYTKSEILLSDNAISTEILNPLVSASGIVPFNMPNELVQSDAEIEITISADGQSISHKLR